MAFKDRIKNFLPMYVPQTSPTPVKENKGNSIRRYVQNFQFDRYTQDIASWRDAIKEAERGILPFRVQMQRLYQDTVLNGHVIACIRKRKNMVLLKEFGFYSGEKMDENFTKSMKNEWFYNLMNYALEAELFGYSLIEFGDLKNNAFEDLTVIKRENISPDRLVVSNIVYSPYGADFVNSEFADWSIYVDTPSNKGASICGYGLLYEVAPYEILLKNIQSFNADYAEIYGQPLKHAKTDKLEGKEYDELEKSLQNMASNSYLLTDMQTELNFISAPNGGTGYQVFSNFEERLEKKISKILLGHGSAMDAVPGKLGSNDDIKQSLREIETVDCRRLEHVINKQVIPKLIAIGFPIPKGLTFKFKNDKELLEIREAQDNSNAVTAGIAKTLKDSGLKMDAKYFTDRTGIPVTEIAEPVPTIQSNAIKNSLKELYGDA